MCAVTPEDNHTFLGYMVRLRGHCILKHDKRLTKQIYSDIFLLPREKAAIN